MLDPRLLRENLEDTALQLKKRGFILDTAKIKNLEEQRKQLQIQTQQWQNQRNVSSKAIGQAKAKGEDVSHLLKEMEALRTQLTQAEEQLLEIQNQLQAIYSGIPNLLDESVPVGESEEDNQEIRRWGEPKKFNFTPQDHADLGNQLKLMDFEAATKIAGARFVVLQAGLARLQRALVQFMLDLHTQKHGYREIYVPYLVNEQSLVGTGQLPKFAQDQFMVQNWPFYLIPTAEVPVTNMVRDCIIEASDLPLKWVAHTPCFRSEAGSYGKDTRGMIRQHQFEKVEMVQIVKPEESMQALEELTQHAEAVLQALELPYRVVTLCSKDTGFSSAKTYDLEVWLPGQQRYREISSCSVFKDFQARRMQARWRNPATNKPELVHTLNGSGLAVGRTLVAIMENFQDEKGNIHIPQALWKYTDDCRVLSVEKDR